jgi:hypothetical protein
MIVLYVKIVKNDVKNRRHQKQYCYRNAAFRNFMEMLAPLKKTWICELVTDDETPDGVATKIL